MFSIQSRDVNTLRRGGWWLGLPPGGQRRDQLESNCPRSKPRTRIKSDILWPLLESGFICFIQLCVGKLCREKLSWSVIGWRGSRDDCANRQNSRKILTRSALSTSPTLPIPFKTLQTHRLEKEPYEIQVKLKCWTDELIELTKMRKSSKVARVKTNLHLSQKYIFLVKLPGPWNLSLKTHFGRSDSITLNTVKQGNCLLPLALDSGQLLLFSADFRQL